MKEAAGENEKNEDERRIMYNTPGEKNNTSIEHSQKCNELNEAERMRRDSDGN